MAETERKVLSIIRAYMTEWKEEETRVECYCQVMYKQHIHNACMVFK